MENEGERAWNARTVPLGKSFTRLAALAAVLPNTGFGVWLEVDVGVLDCVVWGSSWISITDDFAIGGGRR